MSTKNGNNDERIKSFAKLIKILHKHAKTPVERSVATKFIVDYIYQLRPVQSGLVSKEASKLLSSKTTPDHYYSRTQTAIKIFEVLDTKSFVSNERLELFIRSRCRVHKITQKENLILRDIMNKSENKNIHWTKAYKIAGIELIKFVPKRSKYKYIIENKTYYSINDVCNDYNCSKNSILYRCKNEKYKEWKMELL